MENWNEEQQKFIAKLEETKSIFDEILTKDPDGMVIEHGEQRAKLDSLKKSNDRVLTKLKTREFTVAIVGLEKAGKSTLGNALIKTMVLPEYSERCTYTTTEIRSGDTDVAEVYFYSREEFNQNFKRMLNDVKYPFDSDFFSMTLDNFNTYWHGVETDPERQNIFTVHNGTTAEDIKAILEGKQKLIPLLGQAKMSFGAEYWTGSDEFNEFKIYITGMSGKNPDGSVIRQPHPYAVKNIKIRSTQLAEMSHLVLYDVPGFDSPTELHKRQTEEMLKAADAIILVTNVGDRPNLTGTQLDMLRKGQDADGIKLSAKCFVFGNKIDRAVDSQTARNNFAALKNESVNKYQIALDNHVVCGSARAFLEKIGLIEGNVASSIIDEWGLSGGDGLSLLQEKMQQYYDNDRFEVLRRRAEKTIADAKNFLDEILATAKSQPRVTHSQYFMQAALEAKDNLKIFKEATYDINQKYNEQIKEEQPFSNMIREKIEEIFPNQSTESELLTQIKKSGIVYTSSQPAITRIDSNFREALKSIFLRNIVEATAKATEEKEQEIYAEIKEKFLEIMGVSSNSQYRAELLQSLDELFKALWVKNADQCRFNSLVERFTADLLEALIGAPFASIAKERLRKVANDSFKEFISLATYYENYEGALPDDEDRKLDFFLKIFLHENSNTDAETESTLRKFFNDNKQYINAGVSIATEMLPFSKWAKILMRNGIQFNKIPNDLQYKLQSAFYGSNFMDLQPKERSKKLNDIISSYVLENSKISGKLTVEKLEYMYSLGKLKTEIKDEEEMIKVLNEDIAILQKFTLEAVIFAIGLEKAFISVITKNINIIRKDDETEEGKKLFNEWIQKNLGKCRASEFESVETKVLQDQNRRNIIENVRKVVDKLDA